ncbi:MAG: M20/M25/M40 family metallo-hydrolase, partial [Chitinophagaceae bacterium]
MIKKLLLLILPFSATAQQNFTEDSVFIRHLANETMVNGKAYDLLKHLSKNIGGRLAGSEAYAKAAKWGKQTLEQLGADTVFLQAAKVPNWKRGKNDFCYISAIDGKKQNKPLAMLALGNTIGNAPAIAKGNVMVVNSFAELEERKAEVKGKIVLYQVPFNQANILPGKSYGETGMYRSTGASRAAKYGAIAVMVRSLSSVNDNHPHTGNQRYNDSFPKIPAVALGALDADNLAALCAKQTVEVSLQTHGKMLPDAIDYNVVAEWRGTEQPDKYLLVGGHLDSWDVNEGAHDDGTGIVQTMEVLRSLKAMNYQPKHSIRFVLFANEENGIKGAQAYADSAKKRNEQHVFALES